MAWSGCRADPPCVIQPRALAQIPLPPIWDGLAKGRKAAAVPATNQIFIDKKWWGKASAATRAWTLFHEVGHLEGAKCEPCADRRAGEWLRQLGVTDEASALKAIDNTLQHRSPDRAKAAFHAGFAGSMGVDDYNLFKSQVVTTYTDGVPSQTTLYEVRPGGLVNAESLADWDALFQNAEGQGIGYSITSAFRPMQQQIDLWNERMTPPYPGNPIPYQRGEVNEVGKVKGEAAYPGWSEHQQGTAMDLGFNSDADRDTFAILAEKFNIVRDAAGERWHFGWGGRRRYPLPGDPLGNASAEVQNFAETTTGKLVMVGLVIAVVYFGT